jgi:hypothetical protein
MPPLDNRQYLLAVLMPYALVGASLYLVGSAFVALGLYQLWMLVMPGGATPMIEAPAGRARARTAPLTVVTCVACSLSGVLLVLLWPWLNALGAPALASALAAWGLTSVTWPILAVLLCTLNPWLEERYWRGWLRNRPLLSTVCFAGYHGLVLVAFVPLWLALLAVGALWLTGYCWQHLSACTGNLRAAIFSHALADVSIVLAVSALVAW